jgi:hypothetical protein
MFSSSVSSPVPLLQPFFKDFDFSGHHHSRHKEIENDKHHGKTSHSVDDLNSLQNRLREDTYQPAQVKQPLDSGVVKSRMMMHGFSENISHSAEIQVMTREGDLVTININQASASSSSALQMEQGDSKISLYSESYFLSSGFSMSIEGDLNKEEEKSLAKLINKMSKVSDKFFKGNIKAAFKHAQKIGLDTKHLAGFSMSLEREKSVQAVAAYQQTIQPEQHVDKDLLIQASKFLAEAKQSMVDTQTMLESLAKPEQYFSDLFAGMGQLYFSAEDEEENNNEPLFLKLIENIANDLFVDKPEK